jgi:hypothetical protein
MCREGEFAAACGAVCFVGAPALRDLGYIDKPLGPIEPAGDSHQARSNYFYVDNSGIANLLT